MDCLVSIWPSKKIESFENLATHELMILAKFRNISDQTEPINAYLQQFLHMKAPVAKN